MYCHVLLFPTHCLFALRLFLSLPLPPSLPPSLSLSPISLPRPPLPLFFSPFVTPFNTKMNFHVVPPRVADSPPHFTPRWRHVASWFSVDPGVVAAVMLCLFLPPLQSRLASSVQSVRTVTVHSSVLPESSAVPDWEAPWAPLLSALSLDNTTYGDNFTATETSVLSADPVGRIKIYVYDMPPKFNRKFIRKEPRCLTHMFATEIFFHANILSSGVRTLNPEEADWFYAPVYTTCDLTPHGLPLPFRSPRMMRSAIMYISRLWPYWNRTEGADHFFIVPHDFGACFHYQEEKAIERGIMPLLMRSTLVQTFGQRHHICLNEGSIVVPPYAPPQKMQTRLIDPNTPRGTFVYFRGLFYDVNNDPEGGYYARGARASVWENFKDNPLFDISEEHPSSYYEDMQRSIFCLCPLGWAPWSPRIVESVVFGCIPVIIADDIVLPFSDAIPWKDIAVFVPEKDVPQLDSILASIGPRRILAMQRRLSNPAVKQAMLFPQPPQPGDAFHQVLNGLARKLPHPASARLPPGTHVLNWTAGPIQDLKPWKPESPIYW